MSKKSTAVQRKNKKAASKRQTGRPAARDGFSRIRATVRQLVNIQEKARQIGLSIGDRELLSCSRCSLEEDVTIDGVLIVTKHTDRNADTGLRFSEVDEKKGLYRCPGCGKEVAVPEPDFPASSASSSGSIPPTKPRF